MPIRPSLFPAGGAAALTTLVVQAPAPGVGRPDRRGDGPTRLLSPGTSGRPSLSTAPQVFPEAEFEMTALVRGTGALSIGYQPSASTRTAGSGGTEWR